MHIVSLSAVTWDFHLVGRTKWLTQCWHNDNVPTVFVETPNAGRKYRLKRRLGSMFLSPPAVPVLLPGLPAPVLDWPNMPYAELEAAIRRNASALRRTLERHCVLEETAALVVSPAWSPWLEALPFARVVYDCIDDPLVHAPTPEHHELYTRWESELIQKVDAAVVTVRALERHIHAKRPDLPVALIRNGVAVSWFQQQADATPRPTDVPAGRPIVGFVGALYDWIDWQLVADTARTLPETAFVFVGPIADEQGAVTLRGIDNITLLGRRPHDAVPAYINAFDVCWVPFKQNRVAEAADPIKIYEYLSLGKPVVTTPVGDAAEFGDVISIGRTADEIAGMLRSSIESGDKGRTARAEFAAKNAWSAQAGKYVEFLRSLFDAS